MSLKQLGLILALNLYLSSSALAAHDQVDSDRLLPIFLTLFFHDQLTDQEIAGVKSDNLDWFLKELTEVTGRRTHVITRRHQPGITDFGYRTGDSTQAIEQWRQRLSAYLHANNLPLDSRRHKYVLVTRHNLTHDVGGIARVQMNEAIASLRAYINIAHEVGHLFGATHDNAYFRLSALPPCRTLMYPNHTALVANCYEFSEPNREAIRHYLKDE
ncbi:hypothetical protein NJC38_26265 [Pseudomonas sp. 21LCFQ010]|uniref:hypothetical protein n=1 Tax=Pseudomonas sp. 21LCFQ010 TaxID=2957506 RepID=UPI00209682C3|nr:hypothetical protein [Pseudomonas sp. 21LCFQ010]MCO8165645.1 hypothetical protein [Pseudomonas sp. 21LCFQ010]